MADLETAAEHSIQARATGQTSGLMPVLFMLAGGQDLISPWWSKQRDADLRAFWRKPDHLSGAVYTLESRMTTIPFRVEPRDKSVAAHVRLAEQFRELLQDGSEFGEGWETFGSKFWEDFLTQDNGAFGEIIGRGDPTGPILGMPLGIAHLDSSRCTRTGDPEYPVRYEDDGGLHKLHHTRVMYTASMPSPRADMFGVGFCAVSRALNIARNLLDILTYKQEKLGSRPHRAIIVAKGGVSPAHVREAFAVAAEQMDNQVLERYSKIPVVGSADAPDADLSVVELASLPDGFDERTAVELGMAAIALAFGVDARELWPATSTGATKADALIQHLKARGKGIGQMLGIMERLLAQKFLPPTLKLVHDFQDDAEDRQVAEIRQVRAQTRRSDFDMGAIGVRQMRERMLEDGEISEAQFRTLELDDGRLVDGTSVLTLFYKRDYRTWLNLGLPEPLNVRANAGEVVLDAIEDQRLMLLRELANESSANRQNLIRESMAALEALEELYGKADKPPPPPPPPPQEMQPPPEPTELSTEEGLTPEA